MRRRVAEPGGVRAYLIAAHQRLREWYECADFTTPAIERLELGQAVIVADWQLPAELRPYPLGWRSGVHFYRLDGDDSLTPVRADGTGSWPRL